MKYVYSGFNLRLWGLILVWGAVHVAPAAPVLPFYSWSVRAIAGGTICNIIDVGIMSHYAVLHDLPYLDTVAQGGYAYDQKGVSNGYRLGLGVTTSLTDNSSALFDVCYNRKGETIKFSSIKPVQLKIAIDYIEAALMVEYRPPPLLFLATTLRAGGYAGVLTGALESYSVVTGRQGFPAMITQSWDLYPWLNGIDAGIIVCAGSQLGKGASAIGINLFVMRGFSDLRGSHTSNNQLFPDKLENVLVGLSLEYMISIVE